MNRGKNLLVGAVVIVVIVAVAYGFAVSNSNSIDDEFEGIGLSPGGCAQYDYDCSLVANYSFDYDNSIHEFFRNAGEPILVGNGPLIKESTENEFDGIANDGTVLYRDIHRYRPNRPYNTQNNQYIYAEKQDTQAGWVDAHSPGRIDLPSDPRLSPAQGTLMTWINITAHPDDGQGKIRNIYSTQWGTKYRTPYLALKDRNKVIVSFGDGAKADYKTLSRPGLTFKYNKWYHLALSWNRNGYKLYVDGQPVHTQRLSVVPKPNSAPKVIGGQNDAYPDSSFFGGMDYFKIYNTPLTDQEVKGFYETEKRQDEPYHKYL